MQYLTGRSLSEYRFLRLLVEAIVTNDTSLADPEDLVAVLGMCFGCGQPLTTEELKTPHGLCEVCLLERRWQHN